MSLIEQKLLELENRAMDYIGSAPEGTAAYLETAASSIGDMLYSLPAAISKQAIAFLSRTAQASPDTLLFIVTAGIGTYFISAAFPKINAFILAQLPSGFRQRLEGLGADPARQLRRLYARPAHTYGDDLHRAAHCVPAARRARRARHRRRDRADRRAAGCSAQA